MKTTKFNIADYLDSKEMRTEYLDTVLEEGNAQDVIIATEDIAKAKGMAQNNKVIDVTGV